MVKHYHVAGIGGVGMSALAQALLDAGHTVSGSDRQLDGGDDAPVFGIFRRQGVELFPQDGSAVTPHVNALVVSTAIEPDNPEVCRAQALNIPILHRSAALAELAQAYELIAVTGTSGKSTVTALLGWLLEGAGLNPCVVNGAGIIGWEADGTRVASVRKGARYLVAEADESDKSLMAFNPVHALITNESADHFSLEETTVLFDAFKAKVTGSVIDGRDGAMPQNIRLDGWRGYFTDEGVDYCVPLPGVHNVQNAWNAVRLARLLGTDAALLKKSLAGFRGLHRRLEFTGNCGSTPVFDDYAHNPEKLAAALTALQAIYPQGVAALWRPHGYAPLRKMCTALAEMFATRLRPVDKLLLLPVYDAGGNADRSITSDALAQAIVQAGGAMPAMPQTMDEAEELLRALAPACGCLVTFGARDPDLPRLARRLGRA